MLISIYNYLNNDIKYKYFWIISIYLLSFSLVMISFNFKITYYKKYYSVKKENTYYLYFSINEYKLYKDKDIYIKENKITDYKYNLSNIYDSGLVILSINYDGEDLEEIRFMIINDYIYKVLFKIMKGEYEKT